MLIKLILVGALLLLTAAVMANTGTNSTRAKAGKKMLLALFAVFSVIVVIFPQITNDIAKKLGVGRGADLLLYGLTMVFLAFVINQYAKDRSLAQRLNKLARAVAIEQAVKDTKNQKKLKSDR